jgi:hypothetical protein
LDIKAIEFEERRGLQILDFKKGIIDLGILGVLDVFHNKFKWTISGGIDFNFAH